MKKLFVYGCVAVLGSVALASCKKDYTCTYSNGAAPVNYSKLTKAEAETAETACKFVGGTWSKK